MNKLTGLIALCSLGLGIFLHFYGIHIPYLNLVLHPVVLGLFVAGLLMGGLTHPVWSRVIFLLCSGIFILSIVRSMAVSSLYLAPFILFFPYHYLRHLYAAKSEIAGVVSGWVARYFWLLMLTTSLVFVVMTYRSIGGLYFEGDEWYRFRTYIPAMRQYPLAIAGLLQTIQDPSDFGFHQSYVVNTLYPIVFSVFGTSVTGYLLLSVALHATNALLIGKLVHAISKSRQLAVATLIVFAVLASQSQAVTWVDAVLNTQLAVFFGMLSMLAVVRHAATGKSKDVWLGALFLLLALWSKETALGFFVPVLLLSLRNSRRLSIRTLLPWVIVLTVFLVTRYIPAVLYQTKSPFEIFATLSDPDKRGLLLFRMWTFPLKMFSQTLIPQEVFIEMASWVADMQYPYFVQEKAIRGSTYLNFIQSVVPEMLSYVFSVFGLLFSWITVSRRYRGLLIACYISFFFATIPIVLLTLLFPWWGTVSLIDSRHFYHVSPSVLTIFVLTVHGVSLRLTREYSTVVFALGIGLFALFQNGQVEGKLQKLYSTGVSRNKIVTTLSESVGTPPKRLVVFTTSNKSYYGFAEYMLPFQTSFAHMLPILFAKELNPRGIEYPREFYDRSFFSRGGLVAQGFAERDGFAIGYYLDEKLLRRAVIDHGLSPSELVGFRYDGNSDELENITTALRERISTFTQSRNVLREWKLHDMSTDHIRFAVDPLWEVTKKDGSTIIKNERGEFLFSITPEAPRGRTHSVFSLQFGSENRLRTHVRDYDYDYARIEYRFDDPSDRRLFLMAGNNVQFFTLTYAPNAPLDLFMRTFEYWDDGNDAFLFGKEKV